VVWDNDQVAGVAINVIHQDTIGETDDLVVRRPRKDISYNMLSMPTRRVFPLDTVLNFM
jgi:hypothetical protein